MPKYLRISTILVLFSAAACDAAGPAENDLGKSSAGGGGAGEEVAGEPLIEPAAVPEEVEDPAVQKARSEAALKRLEALRQKQKKLSADAFWESADAANKQQHWKEARDAYQGLAIHHPRAEKAVVAAQRAALASFRLGEYGEGLVFLEDALELFRDTPDEARLLRILGNIHLAIPHWGIKKGGELIRGRWDQGIYQDTHRLDRKTAIRFLEKARAAYENKPDLLRELLDTELDLVAALARFTPFDGAWGVWYYAWSEAEEDDRVDEEGADEHAGEYRSQSLLYRAEPRGMPVDAEGNIIFIPRPEKYATNAPDTAKIKFLLHEITRLDQSENKELAAQAIYRQALLFRARDGSERLQRLQNWWWNGTYPYKADIEAKKPWELADDEVLGLIATHIGVYKVPADENSLRLFERIIEDYPKSSTAERAKLSIAAFYQSRAQYDKAIAAYEKFLRENPESKERGTADSMLQQIRRGEVKIGDTGAQASGAPAVLPLEHRNLTELKGRARPLDMKKFIERFKDGWTRGGEPRYDVYPENPNNLFINGDDPTINKYALAPWKEFSLRVPDDGTHRPKKTEVAIPVDSSGLWLIELFDAANPGVRLSRGLVMLESTAVVIKGSGGGELLWVVDARSGKPVAGAELELFEYWADWESKSGKSLARHRITNLKAGADGLARFTKAANSAQQLVTIRSGDRFAYSGNGYYWHYYPTNQESGTIGMVFTDRPVYRPLNTVQLRVWARQRVNGEYQDAKNIRSLAITVYNAKNEKIFEKSESNSGGGANFEIPLKKDAALGMYRIDVQANGAWVAVAGNQFRVEEYKAPELEVAVAVGDGPAKLGSKIPVKISATYFFGGPVEHAKVKYKVFRTDHDATWVAPGPWDWLYGRGYGRCYYSYPWFGWWNEWGPRAWMWYPWWGPQPEQKKELVKEGSGTLDALGALAFELDTASALRDFGDSDQKYLVEAEVTDSSRRTISGQGEVLATKNQFHLHVDTDRGYYEAGNTMRISVTSLLPSGEPLAVKGELRIAEVAFRGDNGDTIEEAPVEKKALSTGADGKLESTFDAKKPGQYRLSFVAKDAWGGEVVGTTLVWVWGPSFDGLRFKFNHLQIITDKRTYKVGETAKLLISSDVAGAHVLFSPRVDNGHLLAPEVLALNGKTRVVEVPITAAHVPNFFVEATLVAGGKMSEEVRELYVPPPRAELNVSIKPKSAEFRAGREGELEISTTDPSGKPISADVAVSVFDKAVLYIQPELTPDVRKHFWGRTRTHQVQSQSNLRRRYDNWQYMSQPDQQAAYLFTAAMQGWMQREVDFVSGDATTVESAVFGAVNEEGIAQGIGGLGTRGGGPGGGGVDELKKDATKTPASVAAPIGNGQSGRGKSLAAAEKEEDVAFDRRSAQADGRLDDDLGNKRNQDAPSAMVAPTVRRNFADTAMWRAVRTDAHGKATLKWTFPDNLTTWRAKAIALDDETRAGEASTSVVTTKKLLVRLQAPRFFRERDRLVISANVHNRLAGEKKVKVELDVTDSLLKVEGEKSRWVNVPKNGEQRVDFWVTVHGEGEARVKVSALTDEESDAKEMLFPVLVHGFMKTDSAVGSISAKTGNLAEQSLTLKIPAERRMDQGELAVRWSPSLAGAMIDALPYLLEYPYGCTEQTMSRFVPAVLTRRTLQLAGGYSLEDLKKIRASMNPQQLGGSGDAEYKKRLEREYKRWDRSPVYNTALMDDMIAEGLARITKMQRPDGGWGWWGNDRSSIYTTAYVLFGLFEARQADTGVPEILTARGLQAMQALLPSHLSYYREHEWISDTDAFFAYVMSLYGRSDDTLNKYLFDRRAKLSVYGKSLLALALWNLNKKDDARLVLRNAEQFLKEDPENETAWVDTRTEGWWYWWNNDIESNAFFLRALVTIKPDDARAPRVVKWLLNHRKNGWYWSSTRDTAIVISTFANYMRATKESEPNYDLEVLLDGKILKTVHIDSKNLLTFDGELRLPTRELPAGEHQLTFRRKGKGAVYFNSYLSYFTLEEDAPASGLEIKVARNYFKLVRDDRKHEVHGQRGQQVAMTEAAYRKVPMKSGDALESGDLILVELMLESKNDYTFLAFEDPKPAGAEPVALRSGVTYGEAVANLELRDDRVVFFLSELNQGKLKLEYRLRAEIPGTFHAMPAHGFAMYAPELKATSEEMRLTIGESADAAH